jgi:hypothetical protein
MEERLATLRDDPAFDLTVDANAVAGLLLSVFGREVTDVQERCASCGTVSLVGTMRVYMRGPGVVVRCPACTEVVLRIAQTPRGTRVALDGVTDLALPAT